MDNVTYSDRVMQEEIFAPILPVIEYTNIDDIINPKPDDNDDKPNKPTEPDEKPVARRTEKKRVRRASRRSGGVHEYELPDPAFHWHG